MRFTVICLVSLYASLCKVDAAYNKDVTCVIDKGQDPVCKVAERIKRRSSSLTNEPSHDPYIPRNNSILYNCSLTCTATTFTSMTQLTAPGLFLRSCFIEITEQDNYACETIRYNYLKNCDKILFLSNTIPDKTFYLVDCLIYLDGGRVCHKKDDATSHAKLVDTGTLARPNEANILAQEEFICEEDVTRQVNCDLNPYIPYDHGLRFKEMLKFDDSVLLKTSSYVINLKRTCVETWCGYWGTPASSRRQYSYSPPGGKIFRCFYAKKQQVCKVWGDPDKMVYNNRGYLDPL
uniref:Uncharacterized protein n=1 Tax=Heliothis virescens TaxID=7102 RepID=A0A2A4K9Q7_HELVI